MVRSIFQMYLAMKLLFPHRSSGNARIPQVMLWETMVNRLKSTLLWRTQEMVKGRTIPPEVKKNNDRGEPIRNGTSAWVSSSCQGCFLSGGK